MKKGFAARALCVLVVMAAAIVFVPTAPYADECDDCGYAIISPRDIRPSKPAGGTH